MNFVLSLLLLCFTVQLSVAQTDTSFLKIQETVRTDMQTVNLLKGLTVKDQAAKTLMAEKTATYLNAIDSIDVEIVNNRVRSISVYSQDQDSYTRNIYFTVVNPANNSISISETCKSDFNLKSKKDKAIARGMDSITDIVATGSRTGYRLVFRRLKA
ncbi:hypothetical protein SAMN05421827_103241 [Pedobacter terrae]|uniref:Uncharacterized protein n=1 Tax=Pedobacter terrae TaxID=405671 RepID=A0A1G7RKI9_9SPHI|nr:hypothetical protein [Pedobacter terrae]SDG10570.1 hypothetical protein SAMN05421827_103241 [Pedobacter terrae]